MSELTPSQAEGERDDATENEVPRTTPSQAEGERVDEEQQEQGETGSPD
jgi:hypothetical protein